MAYIIRNVYTFLNDLDGYRDPRIREFPFLPSIPVLTASCLFYMYFVTIGGKKLLEKVKPFDLTSIITIYNFLQIFANLYIGIVGAYYSWFQPDYSLTCQLIEYDNVSNSMRSLIFLTYLYYLNKVTDLIETLFFLLRKKYNQITFLHVYHHAGMVVASYFAVNFLAGSHVTMLGVLNAFVHAFMYIYYFATSFNSELKSSIWWKKYITQIQIVQFAFLFLHFLHPFFNKNCDFPKWVLCVGCLQNLFMAALFSDFYYTSYMKKKRVRKIETNE